MNKDRYTNECKGFAFIMFTNGEAAQKAVEVINAKEFMVIITMVVI